ncbi:hypothetical protein IG631_15237 [Alternaria alternata]|nr:hypothetical protein IG631_15237 [Alternaria alternata]
MVANVLSQQNQRMSIMLMRATMTGFYKGKSRDYEWMNGMMGISAIVVALAHERWRLVRIAFGSCMEAFKSSKTHSRSLRCRYYLVPRWLT